MPVRDVLGGEYKVARSMTARTMGRGRKAKLETWEFRALIHLLFCCVRTNTGTQDDRRHRMIQNPLLDPDLNVFTLVVKTGVLHEDKTLKRGTYSEVVYFHFEGKTIRHMPILGYAVRRVAAC